MAKQDWGRGLRWDVHVRDGYRCIYCGLDLKMVNGRWDLFLEDHLIPKTKEGPDTELNLVTACQGCNSLKSGFDPRDNGADQLHEGSREHLIQKAKKYIEGQRAKWQPDVDEMVRQISLK